MAKTYSGTKNLYTLNDSKESESSGNSSLNSSVEEEDGMNTTEYEHIQKDYQKLTRKNDELQRVISELQLKNQELHELTQLSERRNQKHEEKQRELIKKLSYFQVNNKELSYEIKRISQELLDSKQNKKVSQNQVSEIKHTIKKSLYDKERFVLFLKQLLYMLGKCEKQEDYLAERENAMQFIHKNILSSENSSKIGVELDFKFDAGRIDTLKEKNKELQEQLEECKATLERQRGEKKKMAAVYNEKISKLRQLYDTLKVKVQQQEQQSRRKLKAVLLQKNEAIESLKSKLKQSRSHKSSLDIKQSREGRKNFIGDGEYSHLQLNQLNDAIENLEMQIIKQFQE